MNFFNDRTQEAHQAATLERFGVLGQLRDDGFVYLYDFDAQLTVIPSEIEGVPDEVIEPEYYVKSEHRNADIDALVAQKQAEFWLDDVRSERDRLIALTDWWALGDTSELTEARRNYRQSLRDITTDESAYTDSNEKSLRTVIWPELPS